MDQVCFVPDGQLGRVVGDDLSGAIQLLQCLLPAPPLQVRYTQVVAGKPAKAPGVLQTLQYLQ